MADNSIAFVFPGQGSQKVGMLAAAHAKFASVRDTFAEASDALGYDMWALIEAGPQEDLNMTETTQPVLLSSSVALWRAWQEVGGIAPAAMAGHSLGEYSALVAAGSLTFADALKLVELRGRLMQAAVPAGTGGMTAVVGLDDAAVLELCRACPDGLLEPANFNAPGQVVVAGERRALDWLDAQGRSHGARMVKRLAMSVPSHCSLMHKASEQLAAALADVKVCEPSIGVLHNLDAAPRRTPDDIRSALAAQLQQPVRWADGDPLERLLMQGLLLGVDPVDAPGRHRIRRIRNGQSSKSVGAK